VLNNALHRELPCGLGKRLGRSPGAEDRQRGELDGGGPAAAAGARTPAIVRLGLINKRLGELLGSTMNSLGACGGEGVDGREVRTGGDNGGRGARWRVRVRVRTRSDRGRGFIGAGGRLGAIEVTPVTHAHVERSRHGRRRAPLRRLMALHRRCAGRWIDATWRGPLATDGTGKLPPAQRSDQRSLWCLGMRTRRGYDAYSGLPTWPRMTSRQSASRHSRAFAIR
jgi:hypothetical protein